MSTTGMFWLTRWALTKGIEEVQGEASDGMLTWVQDGYRCYAHTEGKDWHRTRAAAVSRAEIMRWERIASLKKQIAKLEKLKF